MNDPGLRGLSRADGGARARCVAPMGSARDGSRADQGSRERRVQDRPRGRRPRRGARASGRLSLGFRARFGVRLAARARGGRHCSAAGDSIATGSRLRDRDGLGGHRSTADRCVRMDRRTPTGLGRERHRRRGGGCREQYERIGAIAARMHNHTAGWQHRTASGATHGMRPDWLASSRSGDGFGNSRR